MVIGLWGHACFSCQCQTERNENRADVICNIFTFSHTEIDSVITAVSKQLSHCRRSWNIFFFSRLTPASSIPTGWTVYPSSYLTCFPWIRARRQRLTMFHEVLFSYRIRFRAMATCEWQLSQQRLCFGGNKEYKSGPVFSCLWSKWGGVQTQSGIVVNLPQGCAEGLLRVCLFVLCVTAVKQSGNNLLFRWLTSFYRCCSLSFLACVAQPLLSLRESDTNQIHFLCVTVGYMK